MDYHQSSYLLWLLLPNTLKYRCNLYRCCLCEECPLSVQYRLLTLDIVGAIKCEIGWKIPYSNGSNPIIM